RLDLLKDVIDNPKLVVLVSPQNLLVEPDGLVELDRGDRLAGLRDRSRALVGTFTDVLRLANIEGEGLTGSELHRKGRGQGRNDRAALDLAKPCVETLSGVFDEPR